MFFEDISYSSRILSVIDINQSCVPPKVKSITHKTARLGPFQSLSTDGHPLASPKFSNQTLRGCKAHGTGAARNAYTNGRRNQKKCTLYIHADMTSWHEILVPWNLHYEDPVEILVFDRRHMFKKKSLMLCPWEIPKWFPARSAPITPSPKTGIPTNLRTIGTTCFWRFFLQRCQWVSDSRCSFWLLDFYISQLGVRKMEPRFFLTFQNAYVVFWWYYLLHTNQQTISSSSPSSSSSSPSSPSSSQIHHGWILTAA